MDFYKRLTDLMHEQKLRQVDLTRDLGFTSANFYIWKTKGSIPRSDSLRKIADYLKVSESYLLGLSNDRTPESYVQGSDKTPPSRSIPVFAGIPDSGNIFTEYQYITGRVFCSDELEDTDGLFAVRAAGSAMSPIADIGDLIIARHTDICKNGDMCIYKLFGEPGLRWYCRNDKGVSLIAENAYDREKNPGGFKPINIAYDQFDSFDFSVIGKVCEIRKSERNLYRADLNDQQ